MELYRSSVRSSTEALYGVLLKLYTELYRSSIQSSTVASLSSLPSPPFRLCRRLPFVSAVASLCSSAVVARAPLVIYPLKTRHHDATTATNYSATTSLLSRCRRPPQPLPLPQPVCSYQAADDHRNPYLYHNQSAAIALQTTTTTTFTTTSLQLSRCRRLPQPLPLPQPVCSYRAADNHSTIGAQQGCRRRTAGVPRAYRRPPL